MFFNTAIMFYLASLVFFIRLPKSIPTNSFTSDRPCLPVQIPQEEEERKCKNETYEFKDCDLTICGGDRICTEYHLIANNLQYHPYLQVRDVTYMENKGCGPHLNYYNRSAYIKDPCLLSNSNSGLVNDTSFSPWEYVINRDKMRIPVDILETSCSCDLCLGVKRNNFSGNYASIPLVVTRYFRMKDHGTEVFSANFSYGCICDYRPRAT